MEARFRRLPGPVFNPPEQRLVIKPKSDVEFT